MHPLNPPCVRACKQVNLIINNFTRKSISRQLCISNDADCKQNLTGEMMKTKARFWESMHTAVSNTRYYHWTWGKLTLGSVLAKNRTEDSFIQGLRMRSYDSLRMRVRSREERNLHAEMSWRTKASSDQSLASSVGTTAQSQLKIGMVLRLNFLGEILSGNSRPDKSQLVVLSELLRLIVAVACNLCSQFVFLVRHGYRLIWTCSETLVGPVLSPMFMSS